MDQFVLPYWLKNGKNWSIAGGLTGYSQSTLQISLWRAATSLRPPSWWDIVSYKDRLSQALSKFDLVGTSWLLQELQNPTLGNILCKICSGMPFSSLLSLANIILKILTGTSWNFKMAPYLAKRSHPSNGMGHCGIIRIFKNLACKLTGYRGVYKNKFEIFLQPP